MCANLKTLNPLAGSKWAGLGRAQMSVNRPRQTGPSIKEQSRKI